MAIKYINIFPSKALQNLPQLKFWVWKETIWQPWSSSQEICIQSRTRVQISICVNVLVKFISIRLIFFSTCTVSNGHRWCKCDQYRNLPVSKYVYYIYLITWVFFLILGTFWNVAKRLFRICVCISHICLCTI
jgi:hypothetical protein